MKKFVTILLALTMLVSLCACGGGAAQTTAPAGGSDTTAAAGENTGRYPIAKFAISQDPEHLKPYNGNSNPKRYFYQDIYEALFDYDDDHNLVPSIGKSLNIIDSTHYQVEIYDCVYDSAGNHITADDVVYSINWLVSEGEAVKFEVFDSIKAIDEFTIEYTWAYEPSTWDDLEFPFTRCWIFSQKAMEEGNFATSPVGTGPYVVKSYTAGSSLVLEANDDYWLLKQPEIMDTHLDLHRANVQTLEFDVIAEAAQAQIALEQGTVDYCEYIQTMAMDEFTEGGQYADKYIASTTEMGDYYYMMCNMWPGKISTDVNFRLAVWNAIDSAAVCKAMGGDFAPMNTIGNSAFPDWDDRWNHEDTIMNTTNVEKAKEYLDKTAYKGEELVLLCENSEAYQNAATMIQNQLLAIGINTKIESLSQTVSQATQADPTTWDINIASIGGPSLVGAYNRMLGGNQQEIDGQKYTIFFAQDEKLENLYQTAKADATHDYEHIDELIKYATEEMGYVYALAEVSTAVVYTRNITDLYIKEGSYAYLACSDWAGYEAEHSANIETINAEMPEPSELPENVHIFYDVYNPDDGAGMIWTLTLNSDESWTLKMECTKADIMPDVHNYTGDKTFYKDEADKSIVTTTPPMEKDSDPEYANRGAFYEEDGVCNWKIMDDHGLCPVNYKQYDDYVSKWESGDRSMVLTK